MSRTRSASKGTITYLGDAHDLPLNTVLTRNIAAAVIGSNLTWELLSHALNVGPDTIRSRLYLHTPWPVSSMDTVARLVGVKPCLLLADRPSTVATVMAEKRAALRGLHEDNPNPSRQTLRNWVDVVYSPHYTQLVFGEVTDDRA